MRPFDVANGARMRPPVTLLTIVLVFGVFPRWGVAQETMAPNDRAPLVPGFGVEAETTPVRGFGPAAEGESGGMPARSSASNVSRADTAKQEAEARRLISFYTALDTNKNKRIEPSEIAASRYRDLVAKRIREAGMDPTRPIDYTKFIKKRLDNAGVSSSNAKRALQRTAPKTQERSARSRGTVSKPRSRRERQAEIPDWISEKDANGDQQVSLSEFANRLNDEAVTKFRGRDANDDGFITIAEYLRSEDE